MQISLLMDYMDMWAKSMKGLDSRRLGYPIKSAGMSNAPSTSFDDMVEQADKEIIKVIGAVIDSLDKGQRDAIWSRWLHTKKPQYYELKLELALDNLLTIVGRRLGL